MADEIQALTQINAALEQVEDVDVRRRVLEWAWKKFLPAPVAPPSDPRGQPNGATKTHSNDEISAAEIVRAARPEGGTQQLLVLAHWLEKHGGKLKWSTSDLNGAFDNAKLKRLSNPSQFVADAVRQGFVRGESTSRTLTQSGEAEVEKLLSKKKGE